jgi:hypothetical protein
MTLIDPATHPDISQPANWRASSLLNGSPGSSDAAVFTGDPAADADHDGLSARLEYALGTSENDGSDGANALRWDPSAGMAVLDRSLTADDAVPVLESSNDLSAWSATWPMTRRIRVTNDREELRYSPPPGTPARVFLRARFP